MGCYGCGVCVGGDGVWFLRFWLSIAWRFGSDAVASGMGLCFQYAMRVALMGSHN